VAGLLLKSALSMKFSGTIDKALGMDASITRRDFLGSILLASGSALLGGGTPRELLAENNDDFTGYGGVGEYSTSNGNTLEIL
jgi:spermidine dehydrogenase